MPALFIGMIVAGDRRLSGRPDRAEAHRHLFRDDHCRDRGGLFFVEFNPLSAYTGGENGLPGVPTPTLYLGFNTIHFDSDWSLYVFLAFWFFVGMVIALRIVRSPVGAVLRAIRDNPLRAAAVGHNIHGYKLTAFVVAAAYAGFAGGLLGVMQGFMPPDAFMFDTSGQLVMQTAIGGAGTLFGPLLGATVWLYLQRFPADDAASRRHLEARARRRVRPAGLLPAPRPDRRHRGPLRLSTRPTAAPASRRRRPGPRHDRRASRRRRDRDRRRRCRRRCRRAIAQHRSIRRRSCRRAALTKRYGGLVANSDIDFTVNHGERRGVIGPNGAGKTTFFKMLTCEVPPTSGTILFEGRDITGMSVTDVCQLGLTKSYQVNQLFNRLTVRENLTIAALAELRGKFRLDLLRRLRSIPGLDEQVEHTLDLVNLPSGPTRRSPRWPMARSAGSRSGLRLRPRRVCCCSTSRSPA